MFASASWLPTTFAAFSTASEIDIARVSFNETVRSSETIPIHCHNASLPYAIWMELGARIKKRRELLGITLGGLGQSMSPKVSKQTVSNWEHGRNLPNVDQAAQLCRILSISADYLVNGIEGGFSGRAAEIAALYDSVNPAMREKIEDALKLIGLSGSSLGGEQKRELIRINSR